jgi:hypothetical protein
MLCTVYTNLLCLPEPRTDFFKFDLKTLESKTKPRGESVLTYSITPTKLLRTTVICTPTLL